MNDMENILIEGLVKYRDGKKWKLRWYIMKKMSPAADSLKLLLYKTYKDRLRITNSNGHHFRTHNAAIKHEIILKNILAIENGFTYDKESNTIGIIYENGEQFVILAFDLRESLIQFQVKLYSSGIYDGISYRLLLRTLPPKSKILQGPCKIHIQNYKFSLTTGVPPKLEHVWEISSLRRYGVIENTTRLCFEGGSKCGGSRGQGVFIFLTENGPEIVEILKLASQGTFRKDRFLTEKSTDRENALTLTRGRNSSRFPKSFSSLYIPRKSFSPMKFESNMTRSWTMVASSQEKISCHSTTESESFNYDKPKPLIRSMYSENYDVPKKLQTSRLGDSGYHSLNTSLECDECVYELKLQSFESKTLGRLKNINKKYMKKRSTSVDLLEEYAEDPMDRLAAEFQKSKMNDYVEMQNSFLHKIKFKF